MFKFKTKFNKTSPNFQKKNLRYNTSSILNKKKSHNPKILAKI